MAVHTETQHTDVSLALYFQEYLSNESRKHAIIDNGEYKKGQVKNQFKRKYHVQHKKYVDHQDMEIYCSKNQFSELQFIGTHKQPHGIRGLVKHYHIIFYPKL